LSLIDWLQFPIGIPYLIRIQRFIESDGKLELGVGGVRGRGLIIYSTLSAKIRSGDEVTTGKKFLVSLDVFSNDGNFCCVNEEIG